MNYPTYPHKPYAPYKPVPPEKLMENKKQLGILTEQEDGTFSLQWFRDYITANFPDLNPEDVKFSMEINRRSGYYDDVHTSIDFTFYLVEMIPHPQYDLLMKRYERELENFHKEQAVYEVAIKGFEIAEKNYKEKVEVYQLEAARKLIARHEKKNRPGKKAIGSKK